MNHFFELRNLLWSFQQYLFIFPSFSCCFVPMFCHWTYLLKTSFRICSRNNNFNFSFICHCFSTKQFKLPTEYIHTNIWRITVIIGDKCTGKNSSCRRCWCEIDREVLDIRFNSFLFDHPLLIGQIWVTSRST